VFHLSFAQVVQIRPQFLGFAQQAGVRLRHEDVAGISAIHHPLREVDAGAGDVVAAIDIPHTENGAAVQADAEAKARALAKGRDDLTGRAKRRTGLIVEEDQGDAVAGGDADERIGIAPTIELRRVAQGLAQLHEQLGLLIGSQARVADDVGK
jgi:hypothetical protein